MIRLLWLAAALFIVYGTSLPFEFVADPQHALDKLSRVPMAVFEPVSTRRGLSIPDMVQRRRCFSGSESARKRKGIPWPTSTP